MRPLIIGTCLVAALGLSAQAQAANLLTNGSFETGGFSGWTIAGSGTTPGIGPTVINGSTRYGDTIPNDPFTFGPDRGGAHQAYFVDDNAAESLSQTVALTAGQPYEVGFDLYATRSGARNPNFFQLVGAIGGKDITVVNSRTTPISVATWTHFADTFTPPTSGAFMFAFDYTSGATPAKDVLVDEVYVVSDRLTPIPAPMAAAVFGSGLAGLAAIRHGRRPA